MSRHTYFVVSLQYYINNIKPEYNILLVAGSSFGFMRSTPLLKLKNLKRSPEAIANVSLAQKRTKGHITIVINKETKSMIKYSSLVMQLIP
jgi:hypothetical protein